MPDPLISILVPCLDGMPHLPRALRSAREAFPDGLAEIVVADGGSIDGSVDWLQNTDVVLLNGPDTSLYEGLNRAVAASRAPYLVWLNSDDMLLPGMGALLEIAREADADIATGEAEIVRDGLTFWASDHTTHQADAASLLFGVPTINSRILSRRILDRAGPFNCDVGLGADRHMMIRLFSLSSRRVRLAEPVYRYEAHEKSRTMAGTWRSFRNVDTANLTLAKTLQAEERAPAAQAALDAFECVATLAAVRTSLGSGKLLSGVGDLPSIIARHRQPAPWFRGVKLRRNHGGKGSGW